MGWLVGIVIVLAVLYGALLVLVQVLGAIGETISASAGKASETLYGAKRWIARRVGRADQIGTHEEVFEPELTISLTETVSPSELESAKREYRHRISPLRPPEIVVPTFPAVPDVLHVPEIQFSAGSTSTLSEHHIPSLLNASSSSCSIPVLLDKLTVSGDLHVPDWVPSEEFPAPPTPHSAVPLVKPRLSLSLPLYSTDAQVFRLRGLLVQKLNNVVRAVHHERIYAFQEEKKRVQKQYDETALSNVRNALRYKCEHAAWEAIKAESESNRKTAEVAFLARAVKAQHLYKTRKAAYDSEFNAAANRLQEFWDRVKNRETAAVHQLFNIAVAKIVTPIVFPREWLIEYDAEQGILVLDLRLPDFERIAITRQVALKREVKTKPVVAKEQTRLAELASCLYILRVLHEIVQHDLHNVANAVTLNGWVEFVDGTTGRDRSVVIISVFAEKDTLREIDVGRVDPVKCIGSLGGRFAGIQHGYVAIAPIVRLNRHDDRVIEGSDVLSDLATGTNLAGMDWDKFEHLIRQLFEKVFAGPDIDVKVTRASRDRGVDAIIFDPDPIRGGKTVIQAKRYVNTVDLSAVRDLYGTVVNEGANKGILVTTSSFGPDAYEFAKDKNLTLLSGRELLGLLEKHGYHYRIDLEEARRLHSSPAPGPR
jgi:predicted metal-dependent hydrolase